MAGVRATPVPNHPDGTCSDGSGWGAVKAASMYKHLVSGSSGTRLMLPYTIHAGVVRVCMLGESCAAGVWGEPFRNHSRTRTSNCTSSIRRTNVFICCVTSVEGQPTICNVCFVCVIKVGISPEITKRTCVHNKQQTKKVLYGYQTLFFCGTGADPSGRRAVEPGPFCL